MLFSRAQKDKELPKTKRAKERLELGIAIAELIKAILEIISKFM